MDDLFDYYFLYNTPPLCKKKLTFFLQMTCFIVVCYKWQSFRFYTKNLVFFLQIYFIKDSIFYG